MSNSQRDNRSDTALNPDSEYNLSEPNHSVQDNFEEKDTKIRSSIKKKIRSNDNFKKKFSVERNLVRDQNPKKAKFGEQNQKNYHNFK